VSTAFKFRTVAKELLLSQSNSGDEDVYEFYCVAESSQ